MIRSQRVATTAAHPRHDMTGPDDARRLAAQGWSDAAIADFRCALTARRWKNADRTSPTRGCAIGPMHHKSEAARANPRRRNGDMPKDAIPSLLTFSQFHRMAEPVPNPMPSRGQPFAQLLPDTATIPCPWVFCTQYPRRAVMPAEGKGNGKHSSFPPRHRACQTAERPQRNFPRPGRHRRSTGTAFSHLRAANISLMRRSVTPTTRRAAFSR